MAGEQGKGGVGRAWQGFFAERARAGNPHHVRVGYSSAANARAMKALVRRLMGPPAARLVLDAGCGDGMLTGGGAGMAGGDRVVGLDYTRGMLDLARAQGLAPVCGDIGRLPFGDGAFDLVACVETVTVTDDPLASVAELARVVAPGGRLVVTGLNARSPLRRLVRRALMGAGHLQPALLDPGEIAAVLQRAGLTVERVVWVAVRLAWEQAAVEGGVGPSLRGIVAPNFALVARRPG
ncbi:MAG TPA: class I SAM-dependent methyltransferase [Azospirillaceae bacterium]|nr:class I SAM-dependent methyltransferase [Azospirillaceae bacterium]